jgi:hypothetical protein
MRRSNQKPARKPSNRRNLRVESLEQRLCLAASLGWDGPGLGAASLSYYIGDVPASVGLEQAEVETAIKTALGAWEKVADLTFTQTTLARQSDSLDITFTSIDGSGGVLAQAYLPDDVNRGRLAGDIEFDLADPWEIGNSRGSSAFDFVYVAVHEIGHALGLDHLNVVGSVMRPNVSSSQTFTTLSTTDMNAVLGLYAVAPGDSSSTNSTDTGGADTGGGTGTAGQGNDTAGDNTPSDDDTSEDEQTRRQGGWRGRFGGWRGRSGRATADTLVAAASHHNSVSPGDVNVDGFVSSLDVLMIINDLNENGPRGLSFGEGEAGSSFSMVDVNGDESVTALDALLVINEMNRVTLVAIAVDESVDEVPTTEESTTTDDDVATEETDTTTEADPVDDISTETEETETTDEAETEEELDDTGPVDDETDNDSSSEPDDETMVDDGPLEEEHEGCHRRHHDPFARFDTNEDSLLTVDEVPEVLWDRLLAADVDEDGAISAAELEAIAREHHRGNPFAAFDANEDGALTVDEVPERLWDRILHADADEDGSVTADEFTAARNAASADDHPHHRESGGHHPRRRR